MMNGRSYTQEEIEKAEADAGTLWDALNILHDRGFDNEAAYLIQAMNQLDDEIDYMRKNSHEPQA